MKRGIGVAQSQWVSVVHPATACEVRILGDGSVEAFSSAQDIGTGTRTILAQVVAEEFGLRPDQIGCYIGDTRYPMGPASGGSRVTGSLTPAARNAGYALAAIWPRGWRPRSTSTAADIVFAVGPGLRAKERRRSRCPSRDAVKKAAKIDEIRTEPPRGRL